MHHGLPFVATSVALEGLPEAESLMPPQDDADDFAHEVVRLYQSEEELANTSKRLANYRNIHFGYEKARESIGRALELCELNTQQRLATQPISKSDPDVAKEATAEINELQSMILEKERTISALHSQLLVKTAEAAQFEKKIEELLNSASWRITKPLRKGYDLFLTKKKY
jgi:hypothetical protein